VHHAKPLVLDRPAGVIVEQRIAASAWQASVRGSGRGPTTARSFSEAVAAFDFDAALKFAVVRGLHGDPAGGDAERRLLAALSLAVVGSDAADSALAETLRVADDTIVRRVARLALTATLQYRGKWEALAALPPADGDPARYAAASSDSIAAALDAADAKASVEAWARAYRGTPEARYHFPSVPVVLPLSLSPNGTPVVPVKVNGREFLFWLDTGSSLTILSSEVAAAAGVAPLGSDTLEIVTATGRVAARAALLSSLALGGMTASDAPAVIVDDALLSLPARGGFAASRVDGIVGFDIIRRMDLELDYAASTATIRQPSTPDPRRAAARNLFWLGYPMVRLIGPNGRPVHFALDTGADETYAALSLLAKTGTRAVRAERRRVSGFGQSLNLRGEVIPRMRMTLRDTPLIFERMFVYVTDYPTLFVLDGTLGGDVGAGGVVRIDMTNGIFAVGRKR
jgi:predicted aspartyl protease